MESHRFDKFFVKLFRNLQAILDAYSYSNSKIKLLSQAFQRQLHNDSRNLTVKSQLQSIVTHVRV